MLTRTTTSWLLLLAVVLLSSGSIIIPTANAFTSSVTTTRLSHLELRGGNSFFAVPKSSHRKSMVKEQLPPPSSLLSSSQSVVEQEERVVAWTVANLFWINDTLLNIYHAAGVAWDNLVPMGAMVGAVLHFTGIYQPYPTLLQSVGDAAWWTGLVVMALNVLKLLLWDSLTASFESMAQELRTDYNKRVMDQSVWIGVLLGSLPLLATGGRPELIGLAEGTSGVLQSLCLGSVAGSVLGWYRQQQK